MQAQENTELVCVKGEDLFCNTVPGVASPKCKGQRVRVCLCAHAYAH